MKYYKAQVLLDVGGLSEEMEFTAHSSSLQKAEEAVINLVYAIYSGDVIITNIRWDDKTQFQN